MLALLKNDMFLCDDGSSSEFLTVEDIKQDLYGEVILRMLKHFKTKIGIKCKKSNSKVERVYLAAKWNTRAATWQCSTEEDVRGIGKKTLEIKIRKIE